MVGALQIVDSTLLMRFEHGGVQLDMDVLQKSVGCCNPGISSVVGSCCDDYLPMAEKLCDRLSQ